MTRRSISFQNACNQYSNRYTMEHIPAWALKPCDNGKYYAPQYRTDMEWYENTNFPGEKGIPRNEGYCKSNNPSWPMGERLDKPYKE